MNDKRLKFYKRSDHWDVWLVWGSEWTTGFLLGTVRQVLNAKWKAVVDDGRGENPTINGRTVIQPTRRAAAQWLREQYSATELPLR